jgi:uncharacterized membrane protein
VPNVDVDNIDGLIAENTSNFVAFGVSFVVIYRFWLTHHRTFGEATTLTGPLVWLNGLWLLTIVFLPFPTQLIGTQDAHNRLATGLYIGTMVVTSVCGVAGQWLVLRTSRPRPAAADLTRAVAPGLVLVASLALALVIAISFPRVGLWALLLLVVSGVVSGQVRRRAQRAANL